MTDSKRIRNSPITITKRQDNCWSTKKVDNYNLTRSTKCENDSAKQYGELVILGYNGSLPQGDKGRRRSKFSVCQHLIGNGVREAKRYITTENPTSLVDPNQYCISYKIEANRSVIVEYERDRDTDLYQIGRSADSSIDFVVLNTIADKINQGQSTISRFACRIIANRNNPEICRIYAAGFDGTGNIFLGENAVKWVYGSENEIDGLTSNGILIMNPEGEFCGGSAVCSPWREVSVGGALLSLREVRSGRQKGVPYESETNILRDGTLIDLCGATLLWRTSNGLKNSPTKIDLERLVTKLNVQNSNYLGEFNMLTIPRRSDFNSSDKACHPYVHFNCGHVSGNLPPDTDICKSKINICLICQTSGPIARLCMGIEPAFYLDNEAPTCAFNPCGHMSSEKTVKYWSNVGIPYGTNGYRAVCPFCATPLEGSPGYVHLIVNDNSER